jgi:hypothetical protein
MFNIALPVFESLIVSASLVIPVIVFRKRMVAGERTAWAPAADTPAPDSATACGDPVTLSATLMAAL